MKKEVSNMYIHKIVVVDMTFIPPLTPGFLSFSSVLCSALLSVSFLFDLTQVHKCERKRSESRAWTALKSFFGNHRDDQGLFIYT